MSVFSRGTTCIYRPSSPHIILGTTVWTHQVIALINSGISTDSHFNLVVDIEHTPLGYIILLCCPTLSTILSVSTDKFLQKKKKKLWDVCHNTTMRYCIICRKNKKMKNTKYKITLCAVYLFLSKLLYFYFV